MFEDVNEDRYMLVARAPGHASVSMVIIAKPSDSSVTVFLQRVAVTVTWTVTPTTFEDKYIVTLESTFETQVFLNDFCSFFVYITGTATIILSRFVTAAQKPYLCTKQNCTHGQTAPVVQPR